MKLALLRRFQPGDVVIYSKEKLSTAPGRRAKDVRPSPAGEYYAYVVDKFWVVVRIQDDGMLLLRTRRGKEHVVQGNDPRLRLARWWHRFFWGHKFPTSADQASGDSAGANSAPNSLRPVSGRVERDGSD